ncbi:cryptochrome/photolyase family protein [Pelagicoccus mobilis]|uniref:Deoxyribodipyrimidine photo-lyase n=1 Tax=Pelagicoccus mobilis TaxID=415221 RepID=A0A934S4S8_9BACT|nr:deoxyribodipyrimidine photo-lyase [Pelagicoccus mobilis]MBK1879777.1 deoxyribodipyrimidine photo-lyase [Pelagicoccus mobilis]
MSEQPPIIVWFRQDLRVADNPALAHAVQTGAPVIPLFVFDEEGEGKWAPGGASRWWLHYSLEALSDRIAALGSSLIVLAGDSQSILLELCERTGANQVYWNRRYEPAAIDRDTRLKKALADAGLRPRSFNGALLHSPLQIANKSGKPFRVFTPFWKHLRSIAVREILPEPKKLESHGFETLGSEIESLELLPKLDWADGFGSVWTPGEAGAKALFEGFVERGIARYAEGRDFPNEDAVSRLSPHLHFGEISPVQIWRMLSLEEHEPFLRQLVWREFSAHLLYHFPDTTEEPLNSAFSRFPWEFKGDWAEAWRRGRTGYPIVDAGMRELWKTGTMHNRVRMVAASFLVKHLLQPWQVGAAWFWDTLLDADLANNTMGWQWVAGCGADAAPYFRIFNPIGQGERFDPSGEYTRRWVPELAGLPDKFLFKPWEAPADVLEAAGVVLGVNYPLPIVSHPEARVRALEAYARMKENEV